LPEPANSATQLFLGRSGVRLCAQQFSQLGDIGRDPPRLVAFAVLKHKSYQPK
jgi:hypothetical protein